MSTTQGRLAEYRAKRDFGETREPSGARVSRRGRSKQPRFVVQQHDATAMHWDFRLEHDGVLLSWAVPKGVPEEPKVSRLAIRTEDHPLDYIDFEGDIPEGSYGAGHVDVWDHGTYTLEELDLDAGKVHVELHGERVAGRYMLVRTAADGRREQWLLRRLSPAARPDRLPLPEHVAPMQPVTGQLPPHADRWAAEVKWSGRRVIAFVSGGRLRLEDDDARDVTHLAPELARLGRALGSTEAVLDGVLVAFGVDGRPDCERLETRLEEVSAATARTRSRHAPLTLLLVDLLQVDGRDLQQEPWETRRNLLRATVADGEHWRVSPAHPGDARALLDAVEEQGLDGIVLKRLGSPYRAGAQSRDWLVVRPRRRIDVVIAGWTERGQGVGIGSLLLGVHDAQERLVAAGSVGVGFTDEMRVRLRERLEGLGRLTSPLAGDRRRSGDAPEDGGMLHFVTPRLVCEVEHGGVTEGGGLLHATYKGLRPDVDAASVTAGGDRAGR